MSILVFVATFHSLVASQEFYKARSDILDFGNEFYVYYSFFWFNEGCFF